MTRNAIWALLLVLLVGCGKAESRSAAPVASGPARPMEQPHADATRTQTAVPGARPTMLEIRVELASEVTSGDDAGRLSRALQARTLELGGYVESATASEWGSRLTLRAPPAHIDALRALLSASGPIARESRTARDVTDAVADLDARVKSAKLEEGRLLELLQTKTGNLADVLAVEKALAEVRERIERMEAEQRSAHARVDLAVIEISLDVRGSLQGAPVGQRLTIAGREGLAAAREALILSGTTALRVGPTALLLAGLLALVWRAARRMRPASGASSQRPA